MDTSRQRYRHLLYLEGFVGFATAFDWISAIVGKTFGSGIDGAPLCIQC
jgi:hypothetical protein